MRSECLAIGAAILLAACASPGKTAADGAATRVQAAATADDPAPPAGPTDIDIPEAPRVTGSALPGAPLPDSDRVIVTARRVDPKKGTLAEYLKVLSDASCPPGMQQTAAEEAAIQVKTVPLDPSNPSRDKIGMLTYVAGYQLTSTDKRFGGLSGVDILDNGNLLAVSDVGNFVWIDLAPDGLTPVRARIAGMRSLSGAVLTDKVEADAEGLAVNGGMALVSFERDHRVLAYDLGRCGAGARGAPIVFGDFGKPLPDAYIAAGLTVDENEGSEALALTPDWYMFAGVEALSNGMSPLSARAVESDPDFTQRIGVDTPEFVGLDLVTKGLDSNVVRAFSLHRSYTPQAGSTIMLNETDYIRYLDTSGMTRGIQGELDERAHERFVETGWLQLGKLTRDVTVDNFEGIAAKTLPDGRVRLYIISDDNFSETQRTLLMVFDLGKPTR